MSDANHSFFVRRYFPIIISRSWSVPTCRAYSWETTYYLYYYSSPLHKKLSSKFDVFLAERSQFDSDHRVDFYAHTCCQTATFGPLLRFIVLCFWGSGTYRPSAPLLYEVASHVKQLLFRPLVLLLYNILHRPYCIHYYLQASLLVICIFYFPGGPMIATRNGACMSAYLIISFFICYNCNCMSYVDKIK